MQGDFDMFKQNTRERALLNLLYNYRRYGHFLPLMIKEGLDINAEVVDGYGHAPLELLAEISDDVNHVKELISMGATPREAKWPFIITSCLRQRDAYSRRNPEFLRFIASLCPGGIRRTARAVVTEQDADPLDMAIQHSPAEYVRILVEAGWVIDHHSMLIAVKELGKSQVVTNKRGREILYYLVSAGGRLNLNIRDKDIGDLRYYLYFSAYETAVSAVEQCRSVAAVFAWMGRLNGRVHGNGRDALRLVGKQVWMTRSSRHWWYAIEFPHAKLMKYQMK